jgi:hypothetical protein
MLAGSAELATVSGEAEKSTIAVNSANTGVDSLSRFKMAIFISHAGL